MSLILTRRLNEVIRIGTPEGDIDVTIYGVKGGQVRLAIEAPKDIPIHRLEIWKRINNGKRTSQD